MVIFQEDAKIPESVLQLYWEHCPQGDYEPLDAVDLLVERSLLSRDKDEFVTLHDLLRDYLIFQSDCNTANLHKQFLETYKAKHPNEWHDDLFVLNDLLKDYLIFKSGCDMANLHKQLLEAYKAEYPGGWNTISTKDNFYFQKNWWNHAVKARVEVELVKEIVADLMTNNPLDHIPAFISPVKDKINFVDCDYHEVFSRLLGFNDKIDKDTFNNLFAENKTLKAIQAELNELEKRLILLPSEKKVSLLKQFPDMPFLKKALTT